jgi:hypothetical protein
MSVGIRCSHVKSRVVGIDKNDSCLRHWRIVVHSDVPCNLRFGRIEERQQPALAVFQIDKASGGMKRADRLYVDFVVAGRQRLELVFSVRSAERKCKVRHPIFEPEKLCGTSSRLYEDIIGRVFIET